MVVGKTEKSFSHGTNKLRNSNRNMQKTNAKKNEYK